MLVFARAGRVVLGTEQGGEWTSGSRVGGDERLLAEDGDLIDALRVFAPDARRPARR